MFFKIIQIQEQILILILFKKKYLIYINKYMI